MVMKTEETELNQSEKRSALGPNTAGLAASKSLFTLSSLSLWVLALCFTVGASDPTPILTIKSPDGDIIDCIKKEDQPAFRHPLLNNHKLQESPTDTPYTVKEESEMEYRWQVWHANGSKCPEGSIPVRRVKSTPYDTSRSNGGGNIDEGHEHVFGYTKNLSKIYGTQATMDVCHPKVGSEEFSLGQIWLVSGSYSNNDINTIEAGWQVYPGLYQDHQPRFFIFWTADTYNQTGCYNLRCSGFVQTSSRILVEGAITQTSIFGDPQVELTIRIWKDQKLGSWWLGVVTDNGILEPVGYWPAVLFTLLSDHAEGVEWGGEIAKDSGRHTLTQMGSGYFGIGKVAYMRNLKVAQSENDLQPLQDLKVISTLPEYYIAEKLNDTCFYYGGPKQIKSRAVHLTLDYIFICFGFILLLLV